VLARACRSSLCFLRPPFALSGVASKARAESREPPASPPTCCLPARSCLEWEYEDERFTVDPGQVAYEGRVEMVRPGYCVTFSDQGGPSSTAAISTAPTTPWLLGYLP
jgi:hypothetical protein